MSDKTAAPFGELDELFEKATKGPWRVSTTEHGSQFIDECGKYDYGKQAVLIRSDDDCPDHPIADCSCNYTCREQSETEANTALIVALVNAYPALKAAHAAARNDALEEAARVCDVVRGGCTHSAAGTAVKECAAAIRALKAAR